jgi:uncharacterized protein YbaA (DUF1428 family)
MPYVDGFVIPIPEKNVQAYARMAKQAGRIWMDHGALQYVECVGDDINPAFGVPFDKLAKAKPGETVIFAFIVYKSRAHRDRVNAKVMKDPRITQSAPKEMPFDIKRMAYGGFKVIVNS